MSKDVAFLFEIAGDATDCDSTGVSKSTTATGSNYLVFGALAAAISRVVSAEREAAEKRGYERGIEEAANYCEGNVMGMSIRRDGPHGGWALSPADKMGTHSGKGYATAIRALKEKA